MKDDRPSALDSYGGLRVVARHVERERRRSERVGKLLANAFLGLASLVFTIGLAIVGAAYSSQLGLDLPLEDLGLIGEIAGSISPGNPGASDGPGGPRQQVAPDLPTAIPSATPTDTGTPTETPLPSATPTASATPSASPTPSRTPLPSQTPLPSATLSQTELAAITPTPSHTPKPTGFPGCDASGKSSFESALIDLINAEREDRGLPAFQSSNRLREAARRHSTDMACSGFFSHTGSDGTSVGDRAFMAGYRWTAVAENIFGTGDTSDAAPQLAFNFWIAGGANRQNLLSEEFRDIGVGYIYEPDSPFGGYFTAVFASP